MIIIGWIVKFFVGGWKLLVQAGTYMLEHWQIFLPLLLLGSTWWFWDARNDVRAEYASHIAADAKAAEIRKLENANKDRAADSLAKILANSHENDILDIRKDYDDKETARLDDTHWRDSMRSTVAEGPPRLPDAPSPLGQPPESGGDCHATVTKQEAYINTLETACAVTTADYNALYTEDTQYCEIYGCR